MITNDYYQSLSALLGHLQAQVSLRLAANLEIIFSLLLYYMLAYLGEQIPN